MVAGEEGVGALSDDRRSDLDVAIEDVVRPGDRQKREDAERAAKRRIEERRKFLVQLMQNPEGRIWIKELLEAFHTFETRIPAFTGDIPATFQYLGVQLAGWQLWQHFDDADPVLASRIRRGERM
jgi:hypothetical protein